MSNDLSATLNLPQTSFPMRANLVEREPQRLAHWESIDLYKRIQHKNAAGPRFILHDGPPFTNGDIHLGHALNKILKDVILRYKTLRGIRAPFHPGWDCHGLPIEYQVMRKLQRTKSVGPQTDASKLETRRACADYACKYIERQRSQFQRLGILADWSQEYRTLDPAYEAEILRTFAVFVEKGLIYRSKKPVYWSIPCATALAEAEIEYHPHTTPSIWVAFPIPEPTDPFTATAPLSIVIWTTTPWTLPANQAVAVHPKLDYVEVHSRKATYLVAVDRAEAFIKTCALEDATLGPKHSGQSLEGLQARHPFLDRASPIVLADYVTTETGTGCVHIAPGHGRDDYLTGLDYKLDVYSPIDDQGRYIDDGQIPDDLVGLSVLEVQGKPSLANQKVLEKLRALPDVLLKTETLEHSYPHCWRSKTPVIFRSLDQWFVALDKDGIRDQVLNAIGDVRWIPHWGENRIRSAIASRPDWCISRQRSWGVPLPAFYDEEGTPLLDAGVIRAVADKVALHGADLWFSQSTDQLLDGVSLPDAFRGKKLVKGADTLDVWIDSGCSHRAVLRQHKELTWPADLYLEGSDQHRGWFQSSLWTAVAVDGTPPYKTVLTHGFIVGEDGKKMSKSHGKALTVETLIKKFGVDLIRLWICSADYRADVVASEDLFKNLSQTYRTLRNTLRFQLGNLYDFPDFVGTSDNMSSEETNSSAMSLDAIDQWALHKTAELITEVTDAYESYAFHKVVQLLNKFCTVTLSATYHDILKDRLYTLAPDDPLRRSSQTALYKIQDVLLRLLAPILCFTTDEAYTYRCRATDFTDSSIFLENWPDPEPQWLSPQTTKEIDKLLEVRQAVNESLEPLRKEKIIGQSLDAQIHIAADAANPTFQLLVKYQDKLPELFIVSQVTLNSTSEADLQVTAKHADGVRCPRSWRWVPKLESTQEWGEVSPRCKKALEASRNLKTPKSLT